MPALPPLPSFRARLPKPVAPDPPTDPVVVNCAAYVDGHRLDAPADPRQLLALVRERGSGFVWLGLHEPDADEMAEVASIFGLHRLAVEDAIKAAQRPKLEKYTNALFMVIKTVRYVDHESPTTAVEIVATGEIMVFVGKDFLVTVRHGQHSALGQLREALEADPAHLAIGPAAVLHAIADRIVDEYLAVVECVEDDIDGMENEVFSPRRSVLVEQIYLLKREVLELRRSVAPLADPLHTLAQTPMPLIPDEIREYFRDVEDHLTRVAERVWTFDEVLTTLVNAALAEVTNRQNEDMRKISSWAALALVPTAIAGIYGMNFSFLPLQHWGPGFAVSVLVMAGICGLLYMLLRRRGWL